MESINLWGLEVWKTVDVINIDLIVSMFWGIVLSRRRELIVIVRENLFVIEIFKDASHESSIFIVSDSSSIVTFTSEVIDSV